jgi:hypothetical protein
VNAIWVLRSAAAGAVALGLLPGGPAGAGFQTGTSADAVLDAAGARVERLFTRAETLICIETVVMQPLATGLSPDGFSRTVESELRLSWAPSEGIAATEARVERKVLRVNGRTPRQNDRGRCTTPEQEATETQPLSMLLPVQRERFAFSLGGTAELDGRPATTVDFRELGRISTDVRAVDGVEDCMSWNFTGGRRGRLWIDQATADVLRLDQHLATMIDLRLPEVLARRTRASASLTLERSDTTIRFGRVAFSDPDETIVLPREAIELRVMQGGGEPRLRTVTTYSDYKRFLTGGRLVTGSPEH